ncbi:MAG: outer membrane beta-barrel protein [Rhizomicrobium sp.]|jgi:hypothetical protein
MNRIFAMATVATLVAFATNAYADNYVTGVYIGGDFTQAEVNYKSPIIEGLVGPQTPNGMSVDVGWRFSKYYTVEASYFSVNGDRNSPTGTTSVQAEGIFLDGMGYLPIAHSDVSIISDVGLGWVNGKDAASSATTIFTASEDRFAGRIGAGVQWQASEEFGVRVLVRYQYMSFTVSKSAIMENLGFVFQF